MHRQRWVATVASLATLLVLLASLQLAGPSGARPATAQEGSPAADGSPVASPEASPGASPEASPVAETAADVAPVFVSGHWRIALVHAQRAAEVPELDLNARRDRDWIVVVADVSNWRGKRSAFRTKGLGIRFAGEERARGFNADSTEAAAEGLDLARIDAEDGLPIGANKTERVVLVFRTDAAGEEPALVLGDDTIPLEPAFARGGSLADLPDPSEPPELTPAEVDEASDGATLETADGPLRLAGVDAPLGVECFGGQAGRRLERLAGSDVLVEAATEPGTAYLWTEAEDGSRSLLNYDLIAGGHAAALPNAGGPFAAWLADGERIARAKPAGLWAACTGPHGVGRDTEPELTGLAVRSDGAKRPYAVWVAWSPLIVTTPDGGGWTFFSAEATEGDDAGDKRLFAARFDPATGDWEQARPMPGGEVQMGPSAVVDAEGIVHLVYSDRERDAEGSFSEIVYTKADGKGGWTDPVPVARDPNSGFQLSPSLALDQEGGLHVMWQDQRAFTQEEREASPSNADIFVSTLGMDEKWRKPVLVNNHFPDAAASRPHLVADGDRLVGVWSVYATALGLESAVRVEWSTRPLADELDWSRPAPLVVGRGEGFGGRLLDLAADPTGGVVMVYGRQANDTFLFLRRLKPRATEWGGDTLLTFGDRGAFPSVTVNEEGVVYVAYNIGSGGTVDVGAVAIPYRSIEPGPEVILTEDVPETQGRPIVTTDLTGAPWIVFFNEPPGGVADEVRVLRNAQVPTEPPPPSEDDAENGEGTPAAEAE